MILFVDTETFCETPINHGTHAYAEGVEVMIESWAIDDGPVIVSDRTVGEPGPISNGSSCTAVPSTGLSIARH
jgi:DNA polymerase